MSKLNKENKMQVLIHGEVIVKPIEKLPKGKRSEHKLFVIGHSETGHNHVLEADKITVIEPENLGDSLFIELLSPGKVVHQKTFDKHETKTLEPGIYEVTYATEYNPFTKVVQRLWD